MPILKAPQKIIPKLLPVTPTELFLQQVKGNYDSIRYKSRGFYYIPPNMGGIFGQQAVLNGVAVLEITDFEVT